MAVVGPSTHLASFGCPAMMLMPPSTSFKALDSSGTCSPLDHAIISGLQALTQPHADMHSPLCTHMHARPGGQCLGAWSTKQLCMNSKHTVFLHSECMSHLTQALKLSIILPFPSRSTTLPT